MTTINGLSLSVFDLDSHSSLHCNLFLHLSLYICLYTSMTLSFPQSLSSTFSSSFLSSLPTSLLLLFPFFFSPFLPCLLFPFPASSSFPSFIFSPLSFSPSFPYNINFLSFFPSSSIVLPHSLSLLHFIIYFFLHVLYSSFPLLPLSFRSPLSLIIVPCFFSVSIPSFLMLTLSLSFSPFIHPSPFFSFAFLVQLPLSVSLQYPPPSRAGID